MALPKLNDNLKYEMTIPSTNTLVTYRPYLVKEEKILLSAFESQDQKQAMRAMVDTVVSCVNEPIKSSELSTFDVEYMFTQIRSKSVGEISNIMFPCQAEGCEINTEVAVDLSEVKVEVEEIDTIVPITDDISVEMQYPPFNSFVSNFKEGITEAEFGFQMLEHCMVAILTEEERFTVKDSSKKEIREFIDSMTSKQFEKIGEFIQNIPSLKHEVKYKCECGHENEHVLEGLQDFF